MIMPASAITPSIATKPNGMRNVAMIAAAFVEFTPAELEAPDCSTFLLQFKAKPRTFNAMGAVIRTGQHEFRELNPSLLEVLSQIGGMADDVSPEDPFPRTRITVGDAEVAPGAAVAERTGLFSVLTMMWSPSLYLTMFTALTVSPEKTPSPSKI